MLNPTAVHFCRIATRLTAAAVAATGLLGLLGWIFDVEMFRAIFSGGVSMKANAAVCLLLAGLSLLLLAPERPRRTVATRLGLLFASVVAVVGGLTLAQHVWGFDFGIDQLLFRESPGAPGTASPGRMGPPGSVSFLLGGLALLLLDLRTRTGWVPSQALAVVIAIVILVPLIGYAYAIQPLYGLSRFTGIAVHTAIAIGLLATGLLTARAGWGLAGVACADDLGGVVARRLLLPAILTPLILGWIRTVGARSGFVDEAFGRPMLVIALIVSFAGIVWSNARVISRLDRRRNEAERAVREALEAEQHARGEAERVGRVKDEFLATLSHELRTPLSAIQGWAQMLLHREVAPHVARQGIETIERNARAQTRLIEDLLDMSRIISGKIRLDLQTVELAGVVAAAIEVVRPAAEGKGVRLEKEIEAVGAITADANRLQQVLWNLLSNAIKFTPRGGSVTVSLRRRGDCVECEVRDTGEGIRPEFLPQVFDRFRQADSSTTRKHGGLGLGLAIVRQLVELHGGSVRAHSEGLEKGSTFTVTLPRGVAERAATGNPEAATPQAGSGRASPTGVERLSGLHVLVVEDEPDVRDLLRRLLEDRGAEVSAAASAGEAFEALSERRPDVLVSDIGMPEEDGYSLIRRVRAHADGISNVPAVALTAYTRAEDRARAMECGFNAHLSKPVEPAALVAVIAKLARVRRADGDTA